MAKHTSPSPVIEAFVQAVRDKLPSTQHKMLQSFEAEIGNTTSSEDGRRARRCAHWAIETAGERELTHPEWRRIKEVHQIWRDTWLGVQFAEMHEGTGRPAPLEDVEIEWVEDAVDVAKLVGEAVGWEHARWDQLLAELIRMELAQ